MTIPNQDLKKCSKCGQTKPFDEFYEQHAFTARSKRTSVMPECKVCSRERVRTRYMSKYDEIRRKDNLFLIEKRKRIRDAAFAAYGGYKCVCCGETEPSFLTLDHINNDGASFRRKITGKRTSAGYPTYIWLAKNGYPPTVQVLCMNCNHGKRMNNGVCPHQVRRNDQSKDVGSSDPKRTAPKLTIVSG
jgi:hypothetical protein